MKKFFEVAAVVVTAIATVVAAAVAVLVGTVLMLGVALAMAALIYGPLGYLLALFWNEIALQYVDGPTVVWYHVSIGLWVLSVIRNILTRNSGVTIKTDPPTRSFVRTR